MRNPMIRTMKLIASMIFLAAILVAPFAIARQSQPAPGQTIPNAAGASWQAQVPAAPVGGIDPSKLPDIEGIHLGMSFEDAYAKIKALFPPGPHTQVTVYYAKFLHAPDKPWAGTITASYTPCGNNACNDELTVRFNAPPNKQVVVMVERFIGFEQGKQPAADSMKATLRQDYGAELPENLVPSEMGWVFDEEGRPLSAATPKLQPKGCAGNIKAPQATGPSESNSTPLDYVLPSVPLTSTAIDQLMADPCRYYVNVYANLGLYGPGNGLVSIVDIKISENAEDIRDAIAGQEYLDSVAAAQKQQH
ncbi:MAG: hypothetical protein ACLP1Y_15100 [Candidatus Acidiferrales bacterium]